jgi:ribosome-binding protein aMBF1 (putative translation factor)
MADGHLNICKECVKARMNKHRETHLEEIRAYDRERAKLPHRKANSRRINAKRNHEVDGYRKSHNASERAVVRGELTRSNVCQVCGKPCKTEGHHYDYNKCKSVIWLCTQCHRQYHTGKTERAKLVQQIVNTIAELKNKEVS